MNKYNIPTSVRQLIELKMYSELIGNCKKYRIKSLYDNIIAVEDAEIILAIFNPNKAKLATHRGYDIKQLGDKFRFLNNFITICFFFYII